MAPAENSFACWRVYFHGLIWCKDNLDNTDDACDFLHLHQLLCFIATDKNVITNTKRPSKHGLRLLPLSHHYPVRCGDSQTCACGVQFDDLLRLLRKGRHTLDVQPSAGR